MDSRLQKPYSVPSALTYTISVCTDSTPGLIFQAGSLVVKFSYRPESRLIDTICPKIATDSDLVFGNFGHVHITQDLSRDLVYLGQCTGAAIMQLQTYILQEWIPRNPIYCPIEISGLPAHDAYTFIRDALTYLKIQGASVDRKFSYPIAKIDGYVTPSTNVEEITEFYKQMRFWQSQLTHTDTYNSELDNIAKIYQPFTHKDSAFIVGYTDFDIGYYKISSSVIQISTQQYPTDAINNGTVVGSSEDNDNSDGISDTVFWLIIAFIVLVAIISGIVVTILILYG